MRGWSRRRLLEGLIALSMAALLTLAGLRLGRNGTPDVERLAADLFGEGRSGPVLAVLFQPADCALYSGLVEHWNELHGSGSLRTVGLGIRFGPYERATYRSWAGSHPEFPVRFDLSGRAERVLSSLGQTHTPTAILLDSERRVRLIVPPTKDPDQQRRLGAIVTQHLESLGVESRSVD